MARTLSISNTPRDFEALNTRAGNDGNLIGNTQGNNAPELPTEPVKPEKPQPETKGQNNNDGNENGGGIKPDGDEGLEILGPKTPRGNGGGHEHTGGIKPKGDEGPEIAGPKTPNGNAYGQETKIRIRENQEVKHGRHYFNFDWPILTEPDRSLFEPDRETRRRDDDRERHYQNSHGANRASARRGQIRDYLRQNLHETLFETHGRADGRSDGRNGVKGDDIGRTGNPIDIQRLTQTVADRLSRTYNDPSILTGRNLSIITQEITHLLSNELRPNALNPTVVPYDRALQIACLLLAQVRPETPAGTPQMSDQEVLEGLLFLQLCCLPGSSIKEMREIMTHRPSILPEGLPWSSFRDTGVLVANLLKEGMSPKTAAYLDASVQRFVKLLIVNNELGVLLAAVRLTADARAGRLPSGSVAALVRIYELIAQLMIMTERAMKEAAETAARNPVELKRMEKNLAFAGTQEPTESEAALRQFLAFNPSAQADSGASAFFSEQVAESSARIAVDSSQRAIVDWLASGRHRFVTEVDLGKPIGIVIDRATDECFTASHIRVVLVRDGSVLGWHLFKSCLVG